MLLNASRTLMFGLVLLGGYSLHGFAKTNGLFEAIELTQKANILSDDVTPYTSAFTGVEAIDNILNLLLLFFWPAVNNKHLDLSVASTSLGIQILSAYTLTVLEGLRQDNARRLVTYTTVTGLLVQLLGYALTGPFYLLIHLLTSTIATNNSPPRHQSLSIAEDQLRALPLSLTLGFIIPTVAMTLPSPVILSTTQKITAILFWQAFPLWTAIIQRTLTTNTIFPYKVTTFIPSESSPSQRQDALRSVYRFALYISATGNIILVGITLIAKFAPDVLGHELAMILAPARVWIPPNPFSALRITSIPQGALWFIQWDLVVTGLAYMIWAVCLKYRVMREYTLPGLFKDLVVRPLILGPMAAALVLVWDRDEFVYERGNGRKSQ